LPVARSAMMADDRFYRMYSIEPTEQSVLVARDQLPEFPEQEAASACTAPRLRHSLSTPLLQQSERVSAIFQQLIDRVVEQHIWELAEVQICVDQLQTENDDLKKGVSVSVEMMSSSGSSSTSEREVVGVTSTASKKKRRQVHASQLLHAFDTPEQTDDAADLLKSPQGGSQLSLGEAPNLQYFQSRSFEVPRNDLEAWLTSNTFEMMIAVALFLNVVLMAAELQVFGSAAGSALGLTEPVVPPEMLPTVRTFFLVGDVMFTGFFALDVLLRICVLKKEFWRHCTNYMDLAVTAASVVEVAVYYTDTLPMNLGLLRVLRIGKLARAIRMLHMSRVLGSLQLLIKCLLGSANMLWWSFCLLSFFQCVAGLILSTLCNDFVLDLNREVELREDVFEYYGTFTRTTLTMFEILFGNFGPPARVLVEYVSEAFSFFFVAYRCVFLYAVLNVINAVFVQQTLKTASTDEEIAFKQKEKDTAAYTRRVKKLFQSVDASGDGTLNLEEFAKLVSSPKLRFWMGQLELEYHDLLSLFEFLDNGDGQITLNEFLEGAARLKGNAKALDIWRVETKVEVLFEEVLQALKGDRHRTSVKAAFEGSNFRHIKTNAPEANC